MPDHKYFASLIWQVADLLRDQARRHKNAETVGRSSFLGCKVTHHDNLSTGAGVEAEHSGEVRAHTLDSRENCVRLEVGDDNCFSSQIGELMCSRPGVEP